MTREEALKKLEAYIKCINIKNSENCDYDCSNCKLGLEQGNQFLINESLKMAFEALKQEPCKDCISRKDAIIAIRNLYTGIPFLRCNIKKWMEKNKKYIECETVIRALPHYESR